MPEKTIYNIYDGEKLVFTGNAMECMNELGIPSYNVSSYAHSGTLYHHIYRITIANSSNRIMHRIYAVYDLEGNQITEGTNRELKDYFDDDKFRATNHLVNVYRKKYRIEAKPYPSKKKVEKQKKKAVKENAIADMLRIYGNTITPKRCNIEEIVEELKLEGIDVNYRESKFGGYVLERI